MNKSIQQALQLGTCALVLTCSACKQDETITPAAGTEGLGEVAMPMSESGNNAVPDGDNLDKKVSAAVADLSDRTGIAADAITVTNASVVNWGSSAVGCPREGMNYTQAIVPGVLLLLEAGGKTYRYHGGSKSELFYCPDDRAEAPAYGSGQEFM